MTKFQLLLSAFSMLLAACATSIPYTNEEYCALENQKFVGLESGVQLSVVHATSERAGSIRTEPYVQTTCTDPKTTAEKQNIQSLLGELSPKLEYNKSFWKKDLDLQKALAQSHSILSGTHQSTQATLPKGD